MREGLTEFRKAASVAAFFASFVSAPALADMTKDQCVDANGNGQELRRVGKLSAASEQLRACASVSCPAIVRDDCARRLDELEKVQPTIAFQVKDASGADRSDVRVTVDGNLLTDRLDGTAIPVDMGEHVFRFEVAGQPPVTRTLILAEGEKSRRELVILGTASSAGPAPEASSATSSASQDGSAPPQSGADAASTGGARRTHRILGFLAGGLGIAATGVGAAFGVIASSQWSTAQRDCPSRTECSPKAMSVRNDAAASAAVSTISFIAGGIFVATGVTLFLTSPRNDQPTVGLTITPAGVSLAGAL